ncbi:MAG: FHA domain-containing protein [Acidimicrobiales bacterium]|nr:FHA domain-containing protein [Acidimicrobiales bacterium]
MSEQLLTVLKLCLLALLYLFFFRVVRAVWAEIGPPQTAPSGPVGTRGAQRRPESGRRKTTRSGNLSVPMLPGPPQLVVVAPPEQQGRAFILADETTVGRAAGCSVTLDDTFVSQIHARIFKRDGQFLVEDLGSTNGTYLNRKRVTGPMVMQPGDRLQVGNTVLELR